MPPNGSLIDAAECAAQQEAAAAAAAASRKTPQASKRTPAVRPAAQPADAAAAALRARVVPEGLYKGWPVANLPQDYINHLRTGKNITVVEKGILKMSDDCRRRDGGAICLFGGPDAKGKLVKETNYHLYAWAKDHCNSPLVQQYIEDYEYYVNIEKEKFNATNAANNTTTVPTAPMTPTAPILQIKSEVTGYARKTGGAISTSLALVGTHKVIKREKTEQHAAVVAMKQPVVAAGAAVAIPKKKRRLTLS